MKKKRWAIRTSILLGFTLSGLFLWLSLRQVDAQGLALTFASIVFEPVILSACALVGSMILRALRWRLIAGMPRNDQRSFSRATYLGILVNLLFPGRIGEFVRVVTLAKLSRTTLALPLASAVIDRLVDIIVLIACASVLYFALPLNSALTGWFKYLLVGTAALSAGLAVFVKGVGYWENRIKSLTEQWLKRWSVRPDVFLSELRHELHGILHGWITLEVATVALAILVCDYLAVATLFLAIGIPLSALAPLLVLVCLAAGSMLPSAPGYVGVYQVAAVVALAFFSQPPEKAIALATVLQLISLGVAFAMNGRGAIGLARRARSDEQIV
jgi:uncharacterized protein (TIRG00374 family)